MYSRWANFAVIFLWLATMTWLVKEKVLPPLLIGDPPDTRTVLAAQELEPLVGWRVSCEGEPIGWALSLTRPLPAESTEIRSRVHFDSLPLGKLTPGWLVALFDKLSAAPPRIEADARSRLLLDSEGCLSRVDSSVRFEPLRQAISMSGHVEGTQLALSIRSGGLTYDTKVPINTEALHADVLSPQTQLPGLHEGQKWTVEACSPLGHTTRPVEVLEATVVGSERLIWQGDMLRAWLVEYRGAPGSRPGREEKPRGRLWVRYDGAVLVQEIRLLSATMKFERMNKTEALALAETHGLLEPK